MNFLTRHTNPKCAELELDYGYVYMIHLDLLHIPELNEIRIK